MIVQVADRSRGENLRWGLMSRCLDVSRAPRDLRRKRSVPGFRNRAIRETWDIDEDGTEANDGREVSSREGDDGVAGWPLQRPSPALARAEVRGGTRRSNSEKSRPRCAERQVQSHILSRTSSIFDAQRPSSTSAANARRNAILDRGERS